MLSSRRLANIARPQNRLGEQVWSNLHRSTFVDALPSRPSFSSLFGGPTPTEDKKTK
jgi:hypothetical protein